MIKSLKNLGKHYFWAILAHFLHFGPLRIFLKNPTLSCTSSYKYLTIYQISEKSSRFRENSLTEGGKDRKMEGRMDEQD